MKQVILQELLNNTVASDIEKISDKIFKINGDVFEILSVDFNTKNVEFRYNHNIHELQFKDELDLVLDKMGIKRNFENISTDIKAPMPGKVLNIVVNKGDEVKKGDPVLILEAMKMENVLKADNDGIIKSILIESNENVEKNQILIEFVN